MAARTGRHPPASDLLSTAALASARRQGRTSLTLQTHDSLPRPVYFRNYRIPAGTLVEPHRHGWGQFLFARRGIMHVSVPDSTLVLLPRLYGMWIPANVRHSIWAADDVDLESLYIRTDAEPQPAARNAGTVVVVTDLVREFIHHACATLGERYAEAGADGLKVRVLLGLLNELEEAPLNLPLPRDEQLNAVCNAIQASPDKAHALSDWARRLAMSERTLARHFRKETGMTFQSWKQRLRLLRSLSLLKDGRSVTAIALELGYSSASAYIFAFRKMFGVPPSGFWEKSG